MQKGSLSRQCHFNMSSIPRDELTLKAEIYVYTPFATPRDKKQNVSVYDADTHQKVGFRSLSRIKPGWSWLPVFSVDKRWLVNSERNKGIYVRLQIDSGPAGVVSKHGYRPSFHPWLLVYTKETMSGSEMLHDLFRSSWVFIIHCLLPPNCSVWIILKQWTFSRAETEVVFIGPSWFKLQNFFCD